MAKFVSIFNKRIRISSITAFKAVEDTKGGKPYLMVRISGKIEIMYPPAAWIVKETTTRLSEVFKDFVQVNEWFISKSLVKSYRVYANEEENKFYIAFDTSMGTSMIIHFKSLEEFRDTLNNMDDLFEVV